MWATTFPPLLVCELAGRALDKLTVDTRTGMSDLKIPSNFPMPCFVVSLLPHRTVPCQPRKRRRRGLAEDPILTNQLRRVG
jgi:hypothetical protein